MNRKEEIIDLTSSFTLANHYNLSNEIINIDSDESFEISSETCGILTSKLSKNNKPQFLESKQDSSSKRLSITENKSRKLGDCPICWDELGKNPLASTKCGHVYCLKCLQKSLQLEKKCPTCRCKLLGSSAYHPLYLG